MATLHEADLRDIEARISRPGKGTKVTEGERNHLREQREREQQRAERTQRLGGKIICSWAEGEPEKWKPAIAMVQIGPQYTNAFTVEPYEPVIDGPPKLKMNIVRHGYKRLVEDWALWKWHTLRGSELDTEGNYVMDCDPPEFQWT